MIEPGAWFSALGTATTPAVVADIEAMLHAHPLSAGDGYTVLDDWCAAARVVDAARSDTRWCDHEEAERERLWAGAIDRIGEDRLFVLVTAATAEVAAAVRRGAMRAAERGGIDDPLLIGAATGGALMAVQHHLLACEAGEADTHYFTRQFALYGAGRWPLGYHRGRFCVF